MCPYFSMGYVAISSSKLSSTFGNGHNDFNHVPVGHTTFVHINK